MHGICLLYVLSGVWVVEMAFGWRVFLHLNCKTLSKHTVVLHATSLLLPFKLLPQWTPYSACISFFCWTNLHGHKRNRCLRWSTLLSRMGSSSWQPVLLQNLYIPCCRFLAACSLCHKTIIKLVNPSKQAISKMRVLANDLPDQGFQKDWKYKFCDPKCQEI